MHSIEFAFARIQGKLLTNNTMDLVRSSLEAGSCVDTVYSECTASADLSMLNLGRREGMATNENVRSSAYARDVREPEYSRPLPYTTVFSAMLILRGYGRRRERLMNEPREWIDGDA